MFSTIRRLRLFILRPNTIGPTNNFTRTVTSLKTLTLRRRRLTNQHVQLDLSPNSTTAHFGIHISTPFFPRHNTIRTNQRTLVRGVFQSIGASTTNTSRHRTFTRQFTLRSRIRVTRRFTVISTHGHQHTQHGTNNRSSLIGTTNSRLYSISTDVRTSLSINNLRLTVRVARNFRRLFLTQRTFNSIRLTTSFTNQVRRNRLVPTLNNRNNDNRAHEPNTSRNSFLSLLRKRMVRFNFVTNTQISRTANRFTTRNIIRTHLVTTGTHVSFVDTANHDLVSRVDINRG